jgi:lysophospholipase L1-like esterase
MDPCAPNALPETGSTLAILLLVALVVVGTGVLMLRSVRGGDSRLFGLGIPVILVAGLGLVGFPATSTEMSPCVPPTTTASLTTSTTVAPTTTAPLTTSTTVAPTTTVVQTTIEAVPTHMATVGDSLSSGFACTGGALVCSWATGTAIQSHATRINALRSGLQVLNVASPGAPVAGFAWQAAAVIEEQPDTDYVTVLFGGNDVCYPPDGETSPTVFRQQFRDGLSRLRDGLPGVRILVVSIPDFSSIQLALLAAGRSWTFCDRYFDNPTSEDPADVQRREEVLSELRTFNTIMVDECALVEGCKSDELALFRHQWTAEEIAGDGIHFSDEGEKVVSAISWDAGFRWS